MKLISAVLVAIGGVAIPAACLASPLVGATSPSTASANDKAFCIRTKGDVSRPGECLFASYSECKQSGAAVFAECYRNPRSANARQMRKDPAPSSR
ncbi:hypothetical protein HMPREF9695_02861 [Afipia broomeae ATCC 49717]|uniref:DUF3551 domain-containing protein n=1 Tax=Afipia broomeae ATCC 49717 TaxID=883078 RepID=K8PDL9_9BRAD|nr:hypothetical protein HMPREF9695_02861 [Afipia broomeae ATCC 49717]